MLKYKWPIVLLYSSRLYLTGMESGFGKKNGKQEKKKKEKKKRRK